MAEARRGMVTEAERALVQALPREREPDWLRAVRAPALAALESEGLPDRKVEDFHYTDLKALLKESFPPVPAARWNAKPRLGPTVLSQMAECAELLFVGGRIHPDHLRVRVPAGVEVESLALAIDRNPELAKRAFGSGLPSRGTAQINTALAADGLLMRVRAGHDAGLIVLHNITGLGAPGSVHMRNLILLEEGASAELIEIYETDFKPSLMTSETLVDLAAGAKLAHTKLIRGEPYDVHLGRSNVRIAARGDYRAAVHGSGAGLAREELAARFEGEGAHLSLGAALLLSGERHFDVTARIEHAAPRCTSDIEARAALSGHAKGVVQVSTRVAPGAQHTDARQLIRGLLLSPRAEFDSKPELEILADDVKCTHGAASGDLDKDALFYLRARGIPEREARALLIEAFLEAGFAKVPEGAVRDLLRDQTASWLKLLGAEATHG